MKLLLCKNDMLPSEYGNEIFHQLLPPKSFFKNMTPQFMILMHKYHIILNDHPLPTAYDVIFYFRKMLKLHFTLTYL